VNKALDPDLKEILSSRVASYTFLSRVYRQELTTDVIKLLVENAKVSEDSETSEGNHTLNAYLRGLAGQDLKKIEDELKAEFAGLFLNVGKYPVYPFESVYTSAERLMMQRAYDEVLQEYRQEGVERAHDFNEPEDHLALELEFMAHLCRKSLDALEAGDQIIGAQYLEKQNDFLVKHLLAWVPKFCHDLENATQSGFYNGIAKLTFEIVHVEKETLPELINAVRALE
jgi:putative dimethyl sulfoxide reductase chaperone